MTTLACLGNPFKRVNHGSDMHYIYDTSICIVYQLFLLDIVDRIWVIQIVLTKMFHKNIISESSK